MTDAEIVVMLPHVIDTAQPGYQHAEPYRRELIARADAGEDWDAVWDDVTGRLCEERAKAETR